MENGLSNAPERSKTEIIAPPQELFFFRQG
jgi:hypothetical protein